eukprot:6209624-Pyramimonas_sp.AAC.1
MQGNHLRRARMSKLRAFPRSRAVVTLHQKVQGNQLTCRARINQFTFQSRLFFSALAVERGGGLMMSPALMLLNHVM